MEKFAKILYKFRFFWLSLIIVITIIFGFSIKIDIDNSLKAWFSKDDPDYIAYEDYLNVFEGGRFLIVALRSENIFSLDILNYIKQKTKELEDLNQVIGVQSLANANKVIGTSEGIEIQPLLAELNPIHLQKIKKYTLEDELFRNYLISPNGEFTTIVVDFQDMPSQEENWVVQQVEEIVYKGKPKNVEVFFSGDMKGASEFNRYTKQNQEIFPILTISIICIAIFILFRSFFINLIILLIIGMSVCWTLGFYSVLGYTFNAITGMIIPLVTVLSIADCVHIIKYFDEVEKVYSKKNAFIHTVKYITLPCFVTSLTTAFGLMSLSISRIDAVKHFGIGGAAGIMFAFLISITMVPFLLTLLPTHLMLNRVRGWEHLLDYISHFNVRWFKYILIVAILGFIVSCLGIIKVKIESNQLEWLPKKGDFYKSSKLIDKYLSGIGGAEIILKGEEDVLKKTDILKRIDKLSSEIEELPHVKKVISLTDYVKRIHKALHEDNPDFFKIPNSQSLIAQELFLFTLSDDGRKELDNFVTSDYSQGRISIKTEAMPSEESVILANSIEKMTEESLIGTGIQIDLTGATYLYDLNNKYLLDSQIKGFILAFITIIGFLFIAFRSVKYGVLSILPNLLPITLIVGIMGWVGVTLNVGTVMVASVALGIAVDDTVHFIMRFRKEYKSNNGSIQEILSKTTIYVGQAIIFTSVINITGFLVLLISGFQPTREFGILISLTLFFALIGDIVVLSASIVAVRKFLMKSNT